MFDSAWDGRHEWKLTVILAGVVASVIALVLTGCGNAKSHEGSAKGFEELVKDDLDWFEEAFPGLIISERFKFDVVHTESLVSPLQAWYTTTLEARRTVSKDIEYSFNVTYAVRATYSYTNEDTWEIKDIGVKFHSIQDASKDISRQPGYHFGTHLRCVQSIQEDVDGLSLKDRDSFVAFLRKFHEPVVNPAEAAPVPDSEQAADLIQEEGAQQN